MVVGALRRSARGLGSGRRLPRAGPKRGRRAGGRRAGGNRRRRACERASRAPRVLPLAGQRRAQRSPRPGLPAAEKSPNFSPALLARPSFPLLLRGGGGGGLGLRRRRGGSFLRSGPRLRTGGCPAGGASPLPPARGGRAVRRIRGGGAGAPGLGREREAAVAATSTRRSAWGFEDAPGPTQEARGVGAAPRARACGGAGLPNATRGGGLRGGSLKHRLLPPGGSERYPSRAAMHSALR